MGKSNTLVTTAVARENEVGMRGLVGKHAVITGAAQGIGLATAERFHQEGAVLCLVDSQPLNETILADKFSDRFTYVAGDIRDAATQQAVLDYVGKNRWDVLVNNADRKAGHFLQDNDKKIWSIDHGLTMHASFKIRTVMFELWGRPCPNKIIKDLELLATALENKNCLRGKLSQFLDNTEIGSLEHRLSILLEYRALPSLDPYKNVPWPIL